MKKQPVVVILGHSLLMEGVAVSLANVEELSLVRIESSVSDIWQQVEALSPDVIVFELEVPHSPFILSLLKERPGILLIGLDVACNRVIVLNSRQLITSTMHDLYQIVESEAKEKMCQTIKEQFAGRRKQDQPDALLASSR